MKKPLTIFLGIMVLGILSGCSNSQEVELLKQQNNILQQQVELQKQTNTYPSNNTVETNNNYDTTPIETTAPVIDETPSYEPTQTSCCKVCSKGKACGDSCISRSYTCHKGPGCACDG